MNDLKNINTGKKFILGIQHVLAMFGATIIVPMSTGLDISLALFCAGIGTLIFHLCTKGMVPVFLGSSLAFIGGIKLVLGSQGIGAVKGGLICAGLIYVLMAGVIKLIGVKKIESLFPPIVTGPIIMVIGLRLSPFAISKAFYNNSIFDLKYALIACIVVITMITVSIFAKGFFRLVPILIAVFIGYLVSLPAGLVDIEAISKASWFGLSEQGVKDFMTMPQFSLSGILAIAPIAVVVFIEHIGDITTNSAVVGKDFLRNPGIHRTMLGDGLATLVAGFIGGPANTTYSENTGVLAVTKVYDPSVLRIAACFAILISFIQKFSVIITNIPDPVLGGVSIILFGMIASVGVRILINAKLDFSHSRNLMISAVILVVGIGVDSLPIANGITISGLAIAALVGVILNKVLPEEI